MGEWYDYKMRINGKNIVEMVQNTGIARIEENADRRTPSVIFPSIKTIYSSVFENVPELSQSRVMNNPDHEIILGMTGDEIYYCSKWSPNDVFAVYITKHLPDEIIRIDRYAPYYDKDMHWYRMGDKCVNRDGEPVTEHVLLPTPKQIRERSGTYSVSLPIGSGNELWGTVQFPAKNVVGEEEYGKSFYFLESIPTLPVRFKSHTEELTPEEICSRNAIARESFRDMMQRSVSLSGLPQRAFQRRTKDENVYYIVTIPCTTDISDNGQLSFTLPEYSVHAEEGRIVVGQAGKLKPVIVTDTEGTRIKKEMKVREIEETYLTAIANNLPLEHQEER